MWGISHTAAFMGSCVESLLVHFSKSLLEMNTPNLTRSNNKDFQFWVNGWNVPVHIINKPSLFYRVFWGRLILCFLFPFLSGSIFYLWDWFMCFLSCIKWVYESFGVIFAIVSRYFVCCCDVHFAPVITFLWDCSSFCLQEPVYKLLMHRQCNFSIYSYLTLVHNASAIVVFFIQTLFKHILFFCKVMSLTFGLNYLIYGEGLRRPLIPTVL